MIQIIIGSFILSVLHPMIPSHWLPMIAIGRAEKWTKAETLWVTGIAGFAHTLSTVIIGMIVGLVGYKLATHAQYVTHIIAPAVLVALGIIYLILDMRHSHHHEHLKVDAAARRSKIAIIIALCVEMFFSPCLEIEAFYFTAGTLGFLGVLVVSIIYMVMTVSIMLLLVNYGLKGVARLNWHFLEEHPRRIGGWVLIGLGVFTYFVHL
jgi:nickel/cobalt exporter